MRQKKDNSPKSVHNKIANVLGNTLKNVQKCYRSSGRRTYIPKASTTRINRTNTQSNNSDKRSISKTNFIKKTSEIISVRENNNNYSTSDKILLTNMTHDGTNPPNGPGHSPRIKKTPQDSERKASFERKRSRNGKKKRLKTQPSPLRSQVGKISRENLDMVKSFGDKYIQKKRQSSYMNHNTASSYNKSSRDLTGNNTLTSAGGGTNTKRGMYHSSSSMIDRFKEFKNTLSG